MANEVRRVPLSELAFIEISGVDKKSKDGETPIKLCNFTDVYNNWAITKNLIPTLMDATANEKEIDLFSLKKGQVAITKDSETRDDIGISTYVADDLDGVVLGYHCALITPFEGKLDGSFLNVFLNSKSANLYFEANASGSGQRFTLTNESIGGIKIPFWPIEKQRKIGSFFCSIDKLIENHLLMNAELEKAAKNIFDYWFVQYEFENENGQPYKSSGGKLVYNEFLKRNIPEGWEVKRVDELVKLVSGFPFKTDDFTKNGRYKIYTIGNVQDGYIDDDADSRIDFYPIGMDEECVLKPNDIIMSLTGHVGRVGIVYSDDALLNQRVLKLVYPEKLYPFIYFVVSHPSFRKKMMSVAPGTSQKNLSPESVGEYLLAFPPSNLIDSYYKKCGDMLKKMTNNLIQNKELMKMRDMLLPLLINGQAVLGE